MGAVDAAVVSAGGDDGTMDVNELAQDLDAVGLDQPSAEAYLRLLQTGPTKAGRLTPFFECSRSTLYRRLDELVDQGCVKKSLGSPTVYQAVEPAALFEERETTLAQRARRLGRVRDRCEGPLETLAGDADADLVENEWVKMEGMGRIFGKVRQITAEAESSIWLASNQETALARHLPDVDRAWRDLERKVQQDAIDTRLLVDADRAPSQHIPGDRAERGDPRARHLDVDEPLQFFLVDDRKLVTWLRPTPAGTLGKADDVAFFTDAPGSLAPHRLLFDRLWAESQPLAAPLARSPGENGEAKA